VARVVRAACFLLDAAGKVPSVRSVERVLRHVLGHALRHDVIAAALKEAPEKPVNIGRGTLGKHPGDGRGTHLSVVGNTPVTPREPRARDIRNASEAYILKKTETGQRGPQVTRRLAELAALAAKKAMPK
jgi:hypothetical protein